MYFRTEGVILKRRDFGEADRIVTFYTRDFGKVTALCKGVRRPRSKKAGHLELGNWCKIFVAKGKNLDLLTEIELKTAFGINEFSENKANKIYHFLEIVKNITPDGQRNQSTFILLIHFLKQIANGEDFNLVSTTFKIKLLSNLGFFSTEQLPDSNTKRFLEFLATEDFDIIKKEVVSRDKSLGPQSSDNSTRTARFTVSKSYLKVLAFLDSMIEDLCEQKLTTRKYVSQFV